MKFRAAKERTFGGALEEDDTPLRIGRKARVREQFCHYAIMDLAALARVDHAHRRSEKRTAIAVQHGVHWSELLTPMMFSGLSACSGKGSDLWPHCSAKSLHCQPLEWPVVSDARRFLLSSVKRKWNAAEAGPGLQLTCRCALSNVPPGAPSLPQLLDVLQSLTDSSFSDRGSNRQRSALGVLSAMTFAAAKLELGELQAVLQGSLVEAWKRKDSWNQSRTKEALPLPMDVMRSLERTFLEISSEDSWLLGGLLLMAWAGLRFSDMQRLDLASVCCRDGFVTGWCWRTKSSKRGMPWAFLISGLCGAHWGAKWFSALVDLRQRSPQQDFLWAFNEKPMSYTMALAQFRRCLVYHGNLSAELASRFTLHSLKATLLSWANSLGLAESERAAQGHHRSRNVSSCVAKYGRDDVQPQIRCQRGILAAVHQGWVPFVPVDRGTKVLGEDRGALVSSRSADADSLDSDVESCGSCDTDVSNASGCSEDAPVSGYSVGPWILNCVSGWAHKAVERDGSSWSFTAVLLLVRLFHRVPFVSAMSSPWANQLKAAKIPEDVGAKLVELGYSAAAAFSFKDEATFDAFVKHFLLNVWKPEGVSPETWLFHPLVGLLRALWQTSGQSCAIEVSSAQPEPVVAPQSVLSLPYGMGNGLVGQGKTVNVLERDGMRRSLQSTYSGTLVVFAFACFVGPS
eukprot:s2142_g11.t1